MSTLMTTKSAEQAVQKLQKRDSYMKKAPYQQHKTRKQAFNDAVMRLNPCTWFAPPIIKAHNRYEYEQDRKHTEEVYAECQEKRKAALPPTKAILDLETVPAPLEIPKLPGDGKLVDPWELPPPSEIH
ncbi:hypothetical protein ACLMJK_003791 [Lecanora helva]